MPATLLIVGDGSQADFAPLVGALASPLVATGRARVVSDVPSALEQLRRGHFVPRTIVLLQGWPGQWTAAEANQLRQAAPLADLAVVLGPWCEGESRTGVPLPGARRLSLRDGSIHRILRELESDAPGGLLASTATDEDRVYEDRAYEHRAYDDRRAAASLSRAVVAIAARDDVLAQTLAQIVADAGASSRVVDLRVPIPTMTNAKATNAKADVVVWDLCETMHSDDQCRELEALAAAFGSPPILGCHGFLRSARAAELSALAIQRGVRLAWLPKPFAVPALVREVAELMAGPAAQSAVTNPPIRGPRFLKSRAAMSAHARANRPRD